MLKQKDSNTLCLKWKRPAEGKMVPATWAITVSVLDRQAVRERSKLQLCALSLAGCTRCRRVRVRVHSGEEKKNQIHVSSGEQGSGQL